MVDEAEGKGCVGPAAGVSVRGGDEAVAALNGAINPGGLTAAPSTAFMSSHDCMLSMVGFCAVGPPWGKTAETLETDIDVEFGMKGSGVAYAALAFDDSAIGVEAELADALDNLLYLMRH
jgi:hypothetical protein